MRTRRIFLFALVAGTMMCMAGYGSVVPRRMPPAKAVPLAQGQFRIKRTEASRVKFVKYRDPSGFFTLDLPQGWQVRTGLKGSDATLGYERVQDTQTGEYYRAENGFTDWYHGTRYRPANEKAAYLSPVSGYINWKK